MASIGEKRIFAALKFASGLKPIVQFATRRSTPRQIDFVGALPDLLQRGRQFGCMNGWRTLKLPDAFLFWCSHIVAPLSCCLLWGLSTIVCTCRDKACFRKFALLRENKTAGSGLPLSCSLSGRGDWLCHIKAKTNNSATSR